MHPVLSEKLNSLEQHIKNDERCLGLYLGGSIAANAADEFSDVDAYLILRDADYPAFKREFYAVCQAIFGNILVWLPEAESQSFVNYAFLFPAGDDLLLYDTALITDTEYLKASSASPKQILFDRAGLLTQTPTVIPSVRAPIQNPLPIINNYWVYMYLNGKYFRRADLFKMLYVQNTLFHTHLAILRTIHPEMGNAWWPKDLHPLPAANRDELLVYFGATTFPGLTAAIQKEMDLFPRDARAACQQWEIEYPSNLELGVRQHLKIMGVSK